MRVMAQDGRAALSGSKQQLLSALAAGLLCDATNKKDGLTAVCARRFGAFWRARPAT